MPAPTKKKILFLITKSNWGGAQRYVYEMATSMQDEYDVVVGCGGDGTMKEKLEAAGVPVHHVTGWQRDVNPLKELQSLRALHRIIKTEQPDIIHLNSSKAGLTGALVARPLGRHQIVFTVHGWPFLEPRPLWWKSLTWLGMYGTGLLSHTLIPISQYDLANARMPAITRKYTEVIYNAVPDIDFLPRAQARAALANKAPKVTLTDKSLLLVTVAELHSKKNIATATKAVAAHNRTNPKNPITYFVIGDGVLRDELQSLIEAENAAKHIALLGHVTDARLYLKAADMFLLPSFQEGLPYALLEAGAAGLPTIASNVCGLPEVIKHQQNGLLFDPYNQATLETALATLADDAALREKLGTAFLHDIKTAYTLETMVQKTKRAYRV